MINETNISVLEKELGFDNIMAKNIELTFEFEDEIGKLKNMVDDPTKVCQDMEDLLLAYPLNCLLKPFNFCQYLGHPFQEFESYEKANVTRKISDLHHTSKPVLFR